MSSGVLLTSTQEQKKQKEPKLEERSRHTVQTAINLVQNRLNSAGRRTLLRSLEKSPDQRGAVTLGEVTRGIKVRDTVLAGSLLKAQREKPLSRATMDKRDRRLEFYLKQSFLKPEEELRLQTKMIRGRVVSETQKMHRLRRIKETNSRLHRATRDNMKNIWTNSLIERALAYTTDNAESSATNLALGGGQSVDRTLKTSLNTQDFGQLSKEQPSFSQISQHNSSDSRTSVSWNRQKKARIVGLLGKLSKAKTDQDVLKEFGLDLAQQKELQIERIDNDYRGTTFFNDSMGERKILTRNLLRDMIISRNQEGNSAMLRTMGSTGLKGRQTKEGLQSRLLISTLQNPIQTTTFQSSKDGESSKNKERVFPYSLLESLITSNKTGGKEKPDNRLMKHKSRGSNSFIKYPTVSGSQRRPPRLLKTLSISSPNERVLKKDGLKERGLERDLQGGPF